MMLHETSGRSSFAYFPTAGIVSPLCMMQNGAAAAVAITGNDGMIGTSLFMGRGGTPDRAVVQSPGHAYRLGANRLRHEFDRGGYFSKLLLQYTHSLFMQMAQTAVCNRYHSIEQQLCRWLLLMLDRMPSKELSLTHELLSRILGVRREGHHGRGRQAPESRRHPLSPRPYHGAGRSRVEGARVRMLRGGQRRNCLHRRQEPAQSETATPVARRFI
jgi:hypothetical protein